MSRRPADLAVFSQSKAIADPTAKCAEAKLFYSERIEMVERAAKDTNPELADYILKAVTEGVSYNYLKAKLEIPCGKEIYYDLYRRFFWLLNKARQ